MSFQVPDNISYDFRKGNKTKWSEKLKLVGEDLKSCSKMIDHAVENFISNPKLTCGTPDSLKQYFNATEKKAVTGCP